MNKAQKTQEITEIKDRFDRMASAVMTDFRGLNVEDMTILRDEFRKAGIEYKVVKNKLVQIAVKDEGFHDAVQQYLINPTAVAWSYDDPASPAKVVIDFAKKHSALKVKCAVLDGKVLDEQGVVSLSKMPGKDELLGTLLATFMEPGTGFVRLLSAGATTFVYLLDARRRQLEE